MRLYIYMGSSKLLLIYYLIDLHHILKRHNLEPTKFINISCLLIYRVYTIYVLIQNLLIYRVY